MSIAITAGASSAAVTSMKRATRRTRSSLRSARANATTQPDGQPSMPASQISRVEVGMREPSIACGGDEAAGLLLEDRQLASCDIEVGAEQRQPVALAG